MNDRILVPYDGSPLSERALEYAFETFPDADVTALHVIQIPDGYWALLEGPEVRAPASEKAEEHARELLESATAIAAERGRKLETEVVTGKPARRIVAKVEDDPYDAIVIGSHGREGLSRLLLGSVAEKVVRRSPIPVLVVRGQ